MNLARGPERRAAAGRPAGRFGEPEDLAGTGVFLASAASDFITGTYIRPAGGRGTGTMEWPPRRAVTTE